MASFEGSIGTPSGGFNLKVEYSISQSVSGNYSDVTATGYVKRNKSTYYPYNSSSSASLTINGTSKSYTGSYDLRSDGYKTITSNTVRVYHNNDGKKSITISFSFNGKLSSYYPNGSISQTITLPAIARYPVLTSGENFTDEGNPTLIFTNPAKTFPIRVKLEAGGNNQLITRDIDKSSTSYTFNLTEEERNKLRKLATTNSLSVVQTVCAMNGETELNSSYKTYTMTIVNGNPVFDDFVFEDINEQTLELTGDNQSVIAGYSDVKVTIPVSSKATAIKQAIMSKYRFNSIDANYSDTNDVSITSNKVANGDFTVYAIDSRGNSKPVTKNATNVINYIPLQKGNISVSRENGVSENVTLKFDGMVNLINFGAIENSIKTAQYRYTIAGKDTWSDYFDLELIVDEQGNFNFEGLIKGDTEALGFNISNAYNIEVIIEDKLSKITYTAILGSGTPHIAYAKNGVGIMGKYDESVGGLLQVGGKSINGKVLFESSSGETGNITLSDSTENYEYIDIFFRNDGYNYSSVRVYKPNGLRVNLISMTQNNSGTYKGIYFRNKIVEIIKNTITNYSSSQFFITGDNTCGLNLDASGLTYITKVIGYRV